MKRIIMIVSILILAALLAGAAYAQGPVSDDDVNAVAKQLYCPVCENTPLDVCPTQACKDWRELIRQQLGDGWTETQVVDYFVANYGTQVLAQPPARGFTVLVWVLPVLGLAGGGLFLWRLLRRWQGSPALGAATAPGSATGPPGLSPDVLAHIEREVEARF